MRKKVLIICETLSGGVRKHIINILQYLSPEKFEIAIAYGENRTDEIFLDFAHKNIERFTFYPISAFVREVKVFQDLKAIMQLNSIIKDFQPEIIHCHSSKAGGAGRLAALFYKSRKIIYTPHGYIMQYPYINKQKKRVFGLIEKYLGKITDYTINVSKGEQAIGLHYNVFCSHKSEVIYNGVEEKELGGRLITKGNRKIVVGTLARFDQSKDPKTFLEIAILIVGLHPNVEVWYAGDGDYFKEEFLEAIKEIPQIKYCGFLSSIDPFLSEIDIYLSTSLHEALPYSIIEAMAMKKPIVASNVEGNNELVIHRYNGYLYTPGDVSQAAAYLYKLINDKSEIDRFQKNSYQLFKEKFHIQNMINRLEEVYEK
ncbi:glycosyltransferase [Bacillus sp. sid0103]|uniref:glycosyltransferase n=1 Tax=Bacillus sp. sid0103 TaxID=2856337 RepID=UPI001C45FC4E|nr:glycosyltransferase [Bacillus sp. sid0103]MBV7505575.1 glycosyltransferase [Bacillus sp. sid0103]